MVSKWEELMKGFDHGVIPSDGTGLKMHLLACVFGGRVEFTIIYTCAMKSRTTPFLSAKCLLWGGTNIFHILKHFILGKKKNNGIFFMALAMNLHFEFKYRVGAQCRLLIKGCPQDELITWLFCTYMSGHISVSSKIVS